MRRFRLLLLETSHGTCSKGIVVFRICKWTWMNR